MILEESTVELATPSGTMRTYISRPVVDPKEAAPRFSGIVLFSEIFQRTGPIGRIAAMLAGHGFVVAVPEIFHDLEAPGTVLAYDPAGTAKGNQNKIGKTLAAYDADARAVVDHLLGRPDVNGLVGAFGVCIGGHLAFRAAFDERVRAAACFYATDIHSATLGSDGRRAAEGGTRSDSLARAAEIDGELMMIWGRQDPHVPDAGRAKIQARLVETNRRFTWHEFNAAHAFMRDEGPRYDPALALTCYRMAIDLFARMRA